MSLYSVLIFLFLLQFISPLLFLIRDGEERCLIDEFLGQSTFMVKYKLFTEDKKDIRIFLPNLRFILREADTNRVIYHSYFVNTKDKVTRKIDKTGLYKVCINVGARIPKEMAKLKIYAYLKIASDNMEKNDFSNAIKTDDVDRMKVKADSIIRLLSQTSEKQKSLINEENENSMDTLSNAKMYKYLNLGQVIISAIIGLIQLNNFRRFLKSKIVV
jgi:hypothetical protein